MNTPSLSDTLIADYRRIAEHLFLDSHLTNQYFKSLLDGRTEAAIHQYIREEIVAARLDELKLACENWEQNPNLPATYLIDRTKAVEDKFGGQS